MNEPWRCPLCRELMLESASMTHRVEHIPDSTGAMYRSAYPNLSEELLTRMAFLHCITMPHQRGQCCREETP